MRILVTGSSGQIGSQVAELLRGRAEVIGLDLQPGQYTTHIGDVADRKLVFSLTKDLEAIIHTASLHAPHLEKFSGEVFLNTNVKGTLNLLESSVEQGVRRFIYTSTTSIYGYAMVPVDRAIWVTESLIPKPRDIYDVTKIAAENLCYIFSKNHALTCLCLRVSRFFPEPERLMAIYRLYRGVDVRDAAKAHILALDSNLQGFEVMNISSRSPFLEEETGDLLENAARVIIKHFPSAEDDFKWLGWELPTSIDRVYVIDKAGRLLGYKPQHNFLEYLDKMIAAEKVGKKV